MSERTGLPDFLVIGAPKAGTTTLAAMLDRLPDVHIAPAKEVSYFDLHVDRGLDWYRTQFSPGTGETLLGEATPSYLYLDGALERIHQTLPGVRLLAVLRDPVARFWSQYWYFRALGVESRRIDQVLDAETSSADASIPGFESLGVGYLDCSRYSHRIEAVRQRFGPGALKVILLEDLHDEPESTTRALAEYVGAATPTAPVEVPRANPGRVPRSYKVARLSHSLALTRRAPRLERLIRRMNLTEATYPQLDPRTRARLGELLSAEYRTLPELLDRPLPERWGAA